MEIKAEKSGSVTILTVVGKELDASNVQLFKKKAREIYGSKVAHELNHVVFELSSLDFIDSSGVGALLSCLREINSYGSTMKLCGISKRVRTILELVRVHRIIEIYNTKEEALASFEVEQQQKVST